MAVIYKYQLRIADLQSVEIPRVNKILSVKEQNGQICLWALVDPESEKTTVTICVYGTGNEIRAPRACLEFIDTVLCQNGLVWHVFKEI